MDIQTNAAVTIQRYYRGVLARKEARTVYKQERKKRKKQRRQLMREQKAANSAKTSTQSVALPKQILKNQNRFDACNKRLQKILVQISSVFNTEEKRALSGINYKALYEFCMQFDIFETLSPAIRNSLQTLQAVEGESFGTDSSETDESSQNIGDVDQNKAYQSMTLDEKNEYLGLCERTMNDVKLRIKHYQKSQVAQSPSSKNIESKTKKINF